MHDDARPGTSGMPATAAAPGATLDDDEERRGRHGGPAGGSGPDDGDAPDEDRRRRRRTTAVVAGVCLLLVLVMTVGAALLVGPRSPAEYGDWLPLDRLWDDCAAGDGAACDELFVESPMQSDYERFGSSCGDRFPGATRACVDLMENRQDERQR
ncbi:hypothetical protein ACPYO6_05155 [Georgenia sp. Z1344]|uniref:hypothetical protein n=1 Tax=Georgenia sp. Z1344 TaxID=3416706 RepID=UPI003CF5043F